MPRRLGSKRPACILFALVLLLAADARASERELNRDAAPGTTGEIETPIQRVFEEDEERATMFPWLGQQLQGLPPFLADTRLDAHFRSAYYRQDRTSEVFSEAWAIGGSIHYQSGWLAELLQVELEGFTSQPLVAPDRRPGSLLLEPIQEGYSVLGIANAKLRYGGLVLTGGRQYLDLPYVNRNDNRMTPNTFEAITLEKPEGRLTFSAGYAWKIKPRNSDRFLPFTEALLFDRDAGFAHAGAVWDPTEQLHFGAIAGAVPDLFARVYGELAATTEPIDGVQLRLDGQFTYQADVGRDLLGPALDDTWNLGLRGSTSVAGAVVRLGASFTGDGGTVLSPFGISPSYVQLIQRNFNRASEKALLASVSYDFSDVGLRGLTGILNFVAGFDGRLLGVKRDAQELDVTLDYRVKRGLLKGLWLRVRGSWLHEEKRGQDGSDVRVILRYDLPVI